MKVVTNPKSFLHGGFATLLFVILTGKNVTMVCIKEKGDKHAKRQIVERELEQACSRERNEWLRWELERLGWA